MEQIFTSCRNCTCWTRLPVAVRAWVVTLRLRRRLEGYDIATNPLGYYKGSTSLTTATLSSVTQSKQLSSVIIIMMTHNKLSIHAYFILLILFFIVPLNKHFSVNPTSLCFSETLSAPPDILFLSETHGNISNKQRKMIETCTLLFLLNAWKTISLLILYGALLWHSKIPPVDK